MGSKEGHNYKVLRLFGVEFVTLCVQGISILRVGSVWCYVKSQKGRWCCD